MVIKLKDKKRREPKLKTGKPCGRRKKRARGFALQKQKKEEEESQPSMEEVDESLPSSFLHISSHENDALHPVPPSTLDTNRRKRKPTTPVRRITRSNARPHRQRTSPQIFDPSPPNQKRSYNRSKFYNDAYSTRLKEKLNILASEHTTIKNLYHSNIGKNEENDRIECNIDFGRSKAKVVHSSTLEQLISNTFRGVPQSVEKEVLIRLGFTGKGRPLDNETKKKNLFTGVRMMSHYFWGLRSTPSHDAHVLGEGLVDGKLFGKDGGFDVMSCMARTFTRFVFAPWRVLRAIDMRCQGSLNDTAVREYANIEKDVEESTFKKGYRCLPDRNPISKCRQILNKLAIRVFGIKHNEKEAASQYGDYVECDFEMQLRMIIEEHSLQDKATNENGGGVEIALTADGAQLCGSKSTSQTAAGIKLLDEDALDPDTHDLMFIDTTDVDGNATSYMNYQKYNNHALNSILLHSETRETIDAVFKPFFKKGQDYAKNGLPASNKGPKIVPGPCWNCADMSLLHKLTGHGGACKGKHLFCMCCEAHGDDDMFSYKTGEEVCSLCRKNSRDTCRHRRVNDATEVEAKTNVLFDLLVEDNTRRMEKEHGNEEVSLCDLVPDGEVEITGGLLVNLRGSISADGCPTLPKREYCLHMKHSEEAEEVISSSHFIYCPEMLVHDVGKTNIDFRPNDVQDRNTFDTHVFNDLKLRGFKPREVAQMTAVERQDMLLDSLKLGQKIRMIRNALVKEVDDAIARVESCIPCILHCKNRTAEKFIHQLLTHGLKYRQMRKDRSNFITEVQTLINTNALGKSSFNEIGQWVIPFDNDKLGDVKLSCPDANKIVDNIDEVISVCSNGMSDDVKERWHCCGRNYRKAMDLLESKNVFGFDEVCKFQLLCDLFADDYISLTGRDGMTNYFHFMVAGHFSYFLLKHKNLYKYSQQGWERINGKAKQLYFHNTQKGGGRGGSSKLLPILLTFCRELLWRFKFGDELFNKEKTELEYAKIPKHYSPTDNDVNDLADLISGIGAPDDVFGTENELEEVLGSTEQYDGIAEEGTADEFYEFEL